MNLILHITTRSDWETAVSTDSTNAVSHPPYTADSLHTEGFIHCSTPAQLLIPANAMFKGQTDLLLLCLDEDLVTAEVVYEDC